MPGVLSHMLGVTWRVAHGTNANIHRHRLFCCLLPSYAQQHSLIRSKNPLFLLVKLIEGVAFSYQYNIPRSIVLGKHFSVIYSAYKVPAWNMQMGPEVFHWCLLAPVFLRTEYTVYIWTLQHILWSIVYRSLYSLYCTTHGTVNSILLSLPYYRVALIALKSPRIRSYGEREREHR